MARYSSFKKDREAIQARAMGDKRLVSGEGLRNFKIDDHYQLPTGHDMLNYKGVSATALAERVAKKRRKIIASRVIGYYSRITPKRR